MRTITEIVGLLRDRESRIKGLDFDPAQARLVSGRLELKQGEYPLLPAGQDMLLEALGIPPGYYERIPADLQELTVNRLLRDVVGRDNLGGRRAYVYDGQIVGFARANQAYVPGVAVLSVVRGVLGGQPVGVDGFSLAPWGFQLQLVFPGKFVEPSVGDVTHAGILLEHSDLGLYQTTLVGHLKRLRCSNGLVVPERVPGVKLGNLRASRDGFLGEMEAQCRRLWATMDQQLQRFASLKEVSVEDPLELTRSMLRQARLSALQGRVDTALRQEPELGSTMYAVVNAFSRVTTHDASLSLRERQALVRVAHKAYEARVCNYCRQPLAGGRCHDPG